MRRFLSLIALTALIAFPGCKSAEEIAKEKAASDADLNLMAGTWTLEQFTRDPDADDDGGAKPGDMTITGDILKRTGDWLPRQKITLYAVKEPKQIDLVAVKEDGTPEQRKYTVWVKGSKGKPGKAVERTGTYKQVGLYKVTGDTLTICLSNDENRPSELSQGPGRQFFEYKRVGKGQEANIDKDAKKDEGAKKDGEKKELGKKDDKKLKEPKEEKPD